MGHVYRRAEGLGLRAELRAEGGGLRAESRAEG
jgi:hypothetical protein